jgi:23S rRNA (adenine2030-N6)-methyltransferase
MLSYRHAYHAGNFADVMNHVVLTSILKYMTRKDAPLCYLDTHAGAGVYDLGSEQAAR